MHTGDVILADRGFTCREYAHMTMAEVKPPPFTKGKKQLEKVDIDWNRELSGVRIHTERVIGVVLDYEVSIQTTIKVIMDPRLLLYRQANQRS